MNINKKYFIFIKDTFNIIGIFDQYDAACDHINNNFYNYDIKYGIYENGIFRKEIRHV